MRRIVSFGTMLLALAGAGNGACASGGSAPAGRAETPPPVVVAEPLPPPAPDGVAVTPLEPLEGSRAAPLAPVEEVLAKTLEAAPRAVTVHLRQNPEQAVLELAGAGTASCSWRPVAADRILVDCPAATGGPDPIVALDGVGPVVETSAVSLHPLTLLLRTGVPVTGRWSLLDDRALLELRTGGAPSSPRSRSDADGSGPAAPTRVAAADPPPPARVATTPDSAGAPSGTSAAAAVVELQLATFRDPGNVAGGLAEWRALGLEPYVVTVRDASGRELHTLRVGPWEDEAPARELRERLATEHGRETLLRRRTPPRPSS